jgi:uncharacterized membrane protein YidH (DUF202 family)
MGTWSAQKFRIERNQNLKAATIVGILLIIVGIAGFAFGGFNFTHRHHDADVGPVHISHERHESVPIPPIVSAIALVGGIGLVIVGARN